MSSSKIIESYITNEEEIALLASTYNVVSADNVLRSSFDIDGRELIIIGPDRRLELAKKRLESKQSEAGSSLKELNIQYVIKDDALKHLAGLIAKVKGESAVESIDDSEDLQQSPEVGSIPESSYDSQNSHQAEQEIIHQEVHKPVTPINNTSNTNEGKCKYDVPIIKLEYLKPDIFGLKDSLSHEVSREQVLDFFAKILRREA